MVLRNACGVVADDLASVEIALSPILNHSSLSTTALSGADDEGDDSHRQHDSQVEIQMHLANQRRRIRITVSSYQNARSMLNSDGIARPIIHGFILVYSTTKRSYEVMKVSCVSFFTLYLKKIIIVGFQMLDQLSRICLLIW